ncbi:hypothetical protein [Wolbachia endosymbiont of Pentidionis agamae]|uniref:hypothetical protein n=1 Tax=Wolbachia endosymbiont of Pentidionis agamae TaxID=3110435 RepID=UPI002FD13751
MPNRKNTEFLLKICEQWSDKFIEKLKNHSICSNLSEDAKRNIGKIDLKGDYETVAGLLKKEIMSSDSEVSSLEAGVAIGNAAREANDFILGNRELGDNNNKKLKSLLGKNKTDLFIFNRLKLTIQEMEEATKKTARSNTDEVRLTRFSNIPGATNSRSLPGNRS